MFGYIHGDVDQHTTTCHCVQRGVGHLQELVTQKRNVNGLSRRSKRSKPLWFPWHWISGWWLGTFFIFPHIGNFIIPIDCPIFQRGRYTTNQIWLGNSEQSSQLYLWDSLGVSKKTGETPVIIQLLWIPHFSLQMCVASDVHRLCYCKWPFTVRSSNEKCWFKP